MQPRVDRPEHRRAVVRPLAQAGDVLQQPGDLRGREVGVEDQAGALPDQRLVPGGAQLLAARGGAAVLPDDRVVQRLAGRRVPDADRLALVGDPDRGQLAGAHAGVVERLARDGLRDRPDLARVVLDPAGPGEVLGELALGAPDRLGTLVEHEAGGAGRALVDREDHLRREPTRRAR